MDFVYLVSIVDFDTLYEYQQDHAHRIFSTAKKAKIYIESVFDDNFFSDENVCLDNFKHVNYTNEIMVTVKKIKVDNEDL